MPLLVTFLLSVVFLVGFGLGSAGGRKEGVEDVSVALAFGAMAGVAAFDIIPEMIETVKSGEGSLLSFVIFTLLGLALLFFLDRFVPEHGEGNLTHIGIMSTLAIAIHNIVEGMSVYSVTSQSLSSGALLALGVALHNIPMGMLIYSTTRNEKLPRRIVIVTVASLSTFVGGALMAALESFMTSSLVGILSSLALGMVIYILFFELLGDILRSKRRLYSLLWIMVGLAVVIAGGFLE